MIASIFFIEFSSLSNRGGSLSVQHSITYAILFRDPR
jgi:hypothetical protein